LRYWSSEISDSRAGANDASCMHDCVVVPPEPLPALDPLDPLVEPVTPPLEPAGSELPSPMVPRQATMPNKPSTARFLVQSFVVILATSPLWTGYIHFQ